MIRAKLEKGEPFTVPELMTDLGMSGQPVMMIATALRTWCASMGIAEAGALADAPLTKRQQQTLERMAALTSPASLTRGSPRQSRKNGASGQEARDAADDGSTRG